jgi:hypothetical protein
MIARAGEDVKTQSAETGGAGACDKTSHAQGDKHFRRWLSSDDGRTEKSV